MAIAPSPAPVAARSELGETALRGNFRLLYADVFWYGVLAGSAIAFLAVYAARLGATSFQVGLLTSGPAVVNLLISMPAGHWIEQHPRIRGTFVSSVWYRLGYVVMIVLPWLLPGVAQVNTLIVLSLVMSAPGTVLAIAFNAMFADVVPPEHRGAVVGRRNALLSISLTATSLACGWLLDRVDFPLNYQIVFGLGALGAALSSYHLARIRPLAEVPPRVGKALGDVARPGLIRFADALRLAPGLRFLTRARGRRLLRLDLLRSDFGPFLASYYLFYTFQYVPIPLFPLFLVNDLHLSDGLISIGSALFYGAMLVTSMRLAPLSDRLGHRRVLTLSALLYGLYPLLTGLALDATPVFVASVLGGGVWALLNGGLVNHLMERVPEDDRPAHMALHNLALNLGILSGSLLGPVLGDWLGVRQALLLAAGLRALGGILLGRWS